MKKNLMFLAFAALGLASCNGGLKKGQGGMLYDIHVDKGGEKIKDGDFISVQLIVKTDGDSILFNTYEMGHPSYTVVPKPQSKGDIYSGLELLAEGDSATIKSNIDSISKAGQPKPPFKTKYITYEVKVLKVLSKGKLSDQVFNGRINDYMKGQTDLMKKAEPEKIKKYIADNKLTGTTTASGLFYSITKPGSGEKPAAGDTVEVNYSAKFTNNKLLESNVKDTAAKYKKLNPMAPYKPIRFPVGIRAVIPGWDEGLLLLTKGSKATFVIPSSLAYGEQGNQGVQPFTPLVFEVELVNIIHPDPNAKKPALPPVQAPKPVAK